MKKPRILIIENSIAVTGALESIIRSIGFLSDKFSFIFILPTNSKAIEAVKDRGFLVYELPMKELRRNLYSFVLYLPILLINVIKLKELIRREKIDFMVCNDFYNLLPAVNKILLGRTNYICYVRFLPSKFPLLFVRFWFGLHTLYAKKIVTVSQAVQRQLPASKKTIVIYNELPADPTPYIPSNSTVILYPANYIPGKGQEYALRAFAKIHAQYPQWILRFVGGDMGLKKNKQYKDFLKIMCRDLGIQEQVQWNDFNNHLKDDYLDASIVLNFSDSESFSLTCLEAMYYGRSVIATRCGGPEEIIDNAKTGLLVPIQNIDAMSDSLNLLLQDEDLRQRIESNAYLEVREKFSHENTGRPLESVYLKYIQ